MRLTGLFRLRDRARHDDPSGIDALIAAGHLGRAEAQLRARIRSNPSSLGYRLKLADLLVRRDQPARTAAEYLLVADG